MTDADREILRLMNEYCFRIDEGDVDGFAELFRHGTWEVLGDPGGGATGREAVRAALADLVLYDGKPRTKHVMTNVQIDIEPGGQRATARCYVTVFQAVPPDFPLQPIFAGYYRDRFVCEDGEWRFEHRAISADLVGDLGRHRARFRS